ncbi:DUF2330 domain-containing protein [Polyangium sp. 15x6]|nr:DUF2330 domain-containing protein [Polyangium sp. 15x6]MDI3290359.1 DUF2330 domain-containing protein [Polyangium sp. 15x6]
MRTRFSLGAAGLAALSWAGSAEAFCGFYVSGADAKLYNNATQVVLLRDGTRTVLSMQNNYQGPPDKFAMVVPVPVVLQSIAVTLVRATHHALVHPSFSIVLSPREGAALPGDAPAEPVVDSRGVSSPRARPSIGRSRALARAPRSFGCFPC